MKNSKIKLSSDWKIHRDVFYDINPWDDTIPEDERYTNVHIQEDLFLIELKGNCLDLGWYGGVENGFFGLHLFHGNDWHNCHLLEKREIKDYDELISTINRIIENVEMGKYDSIDFRNESIDDYSNQETVITFE